MDRNQKLILLFIGFCMMVVIGLVAFNVLMPKPEIQPNDIEVSQRNTEEETAAAEKPEEKAKVYVNVFFIGRNENGEEVYKAVKRTYDSSIDGSKIKFSVHSLIGGPKPEERVKGVYSEIPADTRILNINENSDKVIVNLNSSFVNGGGADSLYKRLYQLIKTVKLNSNLPVYLYIDGERADVVGGEGIMITQPLSNSSLEN